MGDTIIGRFASRRDADLAIEHLVQQHGIERTDVFVKPAAGGNSAGDKADGADTESGHPGVDPSGSPALEGPIDVSVDVNDDIGPLIRSAMIEVGGELVAK